MKINISTLVELLSHIKIWVNITIYAHYTTFDNSIKVVKSRQIQRKFVFVKARSHLNIFHTKKEFLKTFFPRF